MLVSIDCKYKGIKEISAGSFIKDGKTINYKETSKIVYDTIINGLPKECSVKVPKEQALNIAKNLSLYDNVIITFDVVIYNSNNVICKFNNIKKKY